MFMLREKGNFNWRQLLEILDMNDFNKVNYWDQYKSQNIEIFKKYKEFITLFTNLPTFRKKITWFKTYWFSNSWL